MRRVDLGPEHVRVLGIVHVLTPTEDVACNVPATNHTNSMFASCTIMYIRIYRERERERERERDMNININITTNVNIIIHLYVYIYICKYI